MMKSDTPVLYSDTFLHGGEPCLDQPGRAVGVAFAKMFQRRALGAEQQDFQQAAVRFDKRNVFVDAGFQVFSDRIAITSSPRIP